MYVMWTPAFVVAHTRIKVITLFSITDAVFTQKFIKDIPSWVGNFNAWSQRLTNYVHLSSFKSSKTESKQIMEHGRDKYANPSERKTN